MAPKELSNDEYLKIVNEAFEEAWQKANSTDGWKTAKTSSEGDIVESKKNKEGKKMFRCTAKLPMSPEKLIKNLQDRDNLTKWNKTVTSYKILKNVSDNVYICHQISDEAGPGGIVSKRDFVLLLKEEKKGDAFVQAGTSVDFPATKDSKIVRAIGYPGAQIVKPVAGNPNQCEYIWLMDADIKGWLPGSVVDSATPFEMFKFLECARKL